MSNQNFNFKLLNTLLKQKYPSIVYDLIPNVVKQGNALRTGDIYGKNGHSLSIMLSRHDYIYFQDYATGDKGDIIKLWSKNKSITISDAIKDIFSRYPDIKSTYKMHEGYKTKSTFNRFKTPEKKVLHGLPPKILHIKNKTDSDTKYNKFKFIQAFPLDEHIINGIIKDLDYRSDKLYKFFMDRGIKRDVVNNFKIFTDTNQKFIMMPFYKGTGIYRIKARNLLSKQYLFLDTVIYRNNNQEVPNQFILFGHQYYNEYNISRYKINTNRLYLTEGEFDAMALASLNYYALSIPNGVNNFNWINYEFNFLKTIKEIVLFMDLDDAGFISALTLRTMLKYSLGIEVSIISDRINNTKYDFKDANELLIKYHSKKDYIDKILTDFARPDKVFNYIKNNKDYMKNLKPNKFN